MDRYTKVVLTLIAIGLFALNLQLFYQFPPVGDAHAQGSEPLAVFIESVSTDAAVCLASYYWLSSGDSGPCIGAW